MKPIFLLIIMGIGMKSIYSQSISSQLLSSAGDYFTLADGTDMHWSLGEISIETYVNVDMLSEGFHQIYWDIVPVTESEFKEFRVLLYPNPFSTEFHIQVSEPGNFQMELRGVDGKLLKTETMSFPSHTVQLYSVSNQILILSILNDNYELLGSYRLIKS